METDKGMPMEKKLKLPAVSTLTATYTHYSPRVRGKNIHDLLSAPLKSHHFPVELKGHISPLGSFSNTLDKVTGTRSAGSDSLGKGTSLALTLCPVTESDLIF